MSLLTYFDSFDTALTNYVIYEEINFVDSMLWNLCKVPSEVLQNFFLCVKLHSVIL